MENAQEFLERRLRTLFPNNGQDDLFTLMGLPHAAFGIKTVKSGKAQAYGLRQGNLIVITNDNIYIEDRSSKYVTSDADGAKFHPQKYLPDLWKAYHVPDGLRFIIYKVAKTTLTPEILTAAIHEYYPHLNTDLQIDVPTVRFGAVSIQKATHDLIVRLAMAREPYLAFKTNKTQATILENICLFRGEIGLTTDNGSVSTSVQRGNHLRRVEADFSVRARVAYHIYFSLKYNMEPPRIPQSENDLKEVLVNIQNSVTDKTLRHAEFQKRINSDLRSELSRLARVVRECSLNHMEVNYGQA